MLAMNHIQLLCVQTISWEILVWVICKGPFISEFFGLS